VHVHVHVHVVGRYAQAASCLTRRDSVPHAKGRRGWSARAYPEYLRPPRQGRARPHSSPCALSNSRSAKAASSCSPRYSSLGWWLPPVRRCRGRLTSRRCCTSRASLATPPVHSYLSSGRRSRSTRGPARDARRCSSAAPTDRGGRTARACACWPGRGPLLWTHGAKRTAPEPPTCAPRQGVRSACSCC